ncbi:MAG: hypothetical protein ACR2NR_14165 [Solirubrobacteraceae bacterium]
MSDYFEQLESELRTAVPRAVAAPARRWGRDRGRPRLGHVALGFGVAVPVVVAVLAIALLGHQGRSGGQLGPSAPPSSQAVGRVPTLAQLKANFAVLRRPQTAADRSWRPDYGSKRPHELRGLERLARRLPGGERVFLTVDRAAPNGYVLRLWIVFADGDVAGSSFTAGDDYTVIPLPSSAPGEPATRWTSILPDGVVGVRWRFSCRARRAGCPPVAQRVAVGANIATAEVPGTTSCSDGSCREAQTASWRGSAGTVRADFRAHERLAAPPFVAPGPSSAHHPGRAVTLTGDGFGPLRFGTPRAATVARIERTLGRPALPPSATECGVVQVSWPIVINPATGALLRAQELTLVFGHGRLVGYQYRGKDATAAVTARGLRLGDTLARGRRLYGRAFSISSAQRGTWSVRTPQGRIDGYASGQPAHGDVSPRSTVASIDAGEVGCPALSP